MSAIVRHAGASSRTLGSSGHAVLGLLLFAAACQPPGAAPPAGPPTAAAGGAAAVNTNLLKASNFDDGKSVPWTTSFTVPGDGEAQIENGAYCITVKNIGKDRWDAQFRHREMVIQNGHTYSLSFKGWGSAPTKARIKVGMSGPPYGEYWSSPIDLGVVPQQYAGNFTMGQPDDPTAELAFHVGGDMAMAPVPFKVCIDDIRLDDPAFAGHAADQVVPTPNLVVNQVGYLPHAKKIASLRSRGLKVQPWELRNGAGAIVARGETTIFGTDGASGEHVHLVDFTAVTEPGTGYMLHVGGEQSFPFDISKDLYKKMKYDALAYFYHNRSGIEIAMPYAGDPSLARPAGHLADKSVACMPGSGCEYALDVSGGWYDAGDHGKYLVNGGISLWTLLNLYERTKHLGVSIADFADGSMNIPENKNTVSDLLDEARWEMEFFLKMQVPAGKPMAGMAHHKMHDAAWTALGVAPHEDTQLRYLHKPSTAATLNLVATAAQCYRIWKVIDFAFAAKCLKAAETAWVAAKANPAVIAPADDGVGGGAYSEDKVDDEFYWAAAELYVSTAKPEYKKFLLAAAQNARFPTEAGGHTASMNWGTTDGLGMISMAIVPKAVDAAWQKQIRANIVAAADRYLAIADKEGYRTLLERTSDGRYIWGSNSHVMNNMIVVALAYDFTKDQKYLDGVELGMDYLLGRNPLAQSYVTGYGEKALQNPHHRFWSHQANPKYPRAPAGVVSGGPNSGIDDPYSKGAGLKGCLPQKCFVDHIEAWGVNEITINWNAPFAWVTAFLDESALWNDGKPKYPVTPAAPAAGAPQPPVVAIPAGAPPPPKPAPALKPPPAAAPPAAAPPAAAPPAAAPPPAAPAPAAPPPAAPRKVPPKLAPPKPPAAPPPPPPAAPPAPPPAAPPAPPPAAPPAAPK